MEWPFNDPYFDDDDLNDVFRYNVRESEVRLRICGTKVKSSMGSGSHDDGDYY
jgi:hypothetical protein